MAGAGEAIGSMVVYLIGIGNARAFHALDMGSWTSFMIWIKTRGAISDFCHVGHFQPSFLPVYSCCRDDAFRLVALFPLVLGGQSV